MYEEIYFESLNLHNVRFEISVIKTNLVKDNILAFGDLQDCEELNVDIVNYALQLLKEYMIDKDVITILTGDMYGESYYINGKKVVIKGCSGKVNYNVYNKTKELYYIYGNHDLNNNSNKFHLDKKILNNGTS